MNGAFYIGATGLQAQQRALDVVANNIANMNTPAFKRSEVRFSELLSTMSSQINTPLVESAMPPTAAGVMMDSAGSVFEQGALRPTGKPLDIAINGQGFIELLGADGRTVLWRGGTLKVNEDGLLTATTGLPLKAMITIPGDTQEIVIDQGGVVRVRSADNPQLSEVGRIELAVTKNPSLLRHLGDGLYGVPADSDLISVLPTEEGAGSLVQGSIEASNVQLSDEMVTLLLMQRAFAANAQVVQAGDQLMAIANGLRR